MYNTRDNIVSLATVPGRSALSIIRCSGSGVLALYKNITKQKKLPLPNFCHLATLYNKKTVLDQSMVTFFQSPKSYTGQNMLEFSAHGGSVIVQKIIETIEQRGFRQALPGEFSYRAFISGKIDLIQAESIATIIDSDNSLDVLYSLNNLKGGLSKPIYKILSDIENIILKMEHELDFEESEIEFTSFFEYLELVENITKEIENIRKTSYLAEKKHSSLQVCLAGKTNAGKSSLFNALLGYNRSIVTQEKGTTRDTIEAQLSIENIDTTLVDTAGIRKAKNVAEKEGVSRTFAAIQESDVVLFIDEKDPKKESEKYKEVLASKHVVYIKSKQDNPNIKSKTKTIFTSTKIKNGTNNLFTHLSTYAKNYHSSFRSKNSFLISLRQKASLDSCFSKINRIKSEIKKKQDLVILSSLLRDAHDSLSLAVYSKDKNEVINKIFKGFCVGK